MSNEEIFNRMVGSPEYAIRLVFFNNPVGFRQSFSLAGFPCNVQTDEQAVAFVSGLVKNSGVANKDVARALLSVPFDATVTEYTNPKNAAVDRAFRVAIYNYLQLKNK